MAIRQAVRRVDAERVHGAAYAALAAMLPLRGMVDLRVRFAVDAGGTLWAHVDGEGWRYWAPGAACWCDGD